MSGRKKQFNFLLLNLPPYSTSLSLNINALFFNIITIFSGINILFFVSSTLFLSIIIFSLNIGVLFSNTIAFSLCTKVSFLNADILFFNINLSLSLGILSSNIFLSVYALPIASFLLLLILYIIFCISQLPFIFHNSFLILITYFFCLLFLLLHYQYILN